MSLPKTFPMKIANGKTIEVPAVGYGTWATGQNSWAKDATLTALKEGYRHIDGAWAYGVDESIGAAIRESGVPREDIFFTSKAWGHFFVPEKLEICLDHVLRNTGLDYIDLFLVHFPVALKPISDEALLNARSGHDATHVDKGIAKENDRPFVDWAHTSAPIAKKAGQQGSFVPTWQAMQALVKTGKCRAVGVSNFSIADIEELLPYSKEIPISCNQVEVHPWLPQTELIEFCRKHDILVTCYSPFAGQKKDGKTLLKDEKVLKLAEKNSMDVGQILQSWAVQRGTSPLGKSATSSRIKSNLAVRKLSEEDFQALNDLKLEGDEGRTVNPSEEWGATLY